MIQNFLAIFLKFGSTFLFVLLELFCFYLIVNNNKHQESIWTNSSSLITGSIYGQYHQLSSFINLKDENEVLAAENAKLLSLLSTNNYRENKTDSIIASNFEFIPALVINNSISKLDNRITINKGKKDGIRKGMGVINSEGIVGVVVYASNNYSAVNSLLNIQTKVSALVERTNTLGDLTWKGKNPEYVLLNSIPQYVSVMVGDTIITSGYSTVFPKGQTIGVIHKIKENAKTGYFNLDIKLNNDLSSINQVYIVSNLIYEDLKDFENESINE